MKPLTAEEIAELRRLERESTPAPWTVLMGTSDQAHAFVQGPHQGYDGEFPAADTQLIVGTRNALPRLLDEVEELRKHLAAVCGPRWREDMETLARARALLK